MAGSGITLQIGAPHANYLARRGGHSHRGHGTFSRSQVLARSLDALRLYQEFTDPLKNGALRPDHHALLLRLLPEPWNLRRFEILNLEGVLAATPDFAPTVTAAALAPADLLAAVAALTPAEKLTLVDQAVQLQAPPSPPPARKAPPPPRADPRPTPPPAATPRPTPGTSPAN
jgi:hypothetical protein